MEASWTASWIWGLTLIALTIAVHAHGIVLIDRALRGLDRSVSGRHLQVRRPVAKAAALIGAVGLLLAVLHGVEAVAWALAYLLLSASRSFHEAILASLDSMTTRGAAGAGLSERWQLMGALEAACGMLVFGISTAFVFTVLQRVIDLIERTERRTLP